VKGGDTFVLDAAVWPQCGFEFNATGGGGATHKVASTVEGKEVTGVNLVFTDDGRGFIDVRVGF
jgi:hypothetical protein